MDETSDRELGARGFSAFFDKAPVGKAVLAPNGASIQVNVTLAALLGYSVAELQACSLASISHPDEIVATREAIRALVAGELESCATDKRLRAKGGAYVPVHVTAWLQRNPDQTPLQFVTYVLDLTERNRASDELRQSELRYRRLFESAKDGILILAPDTGAIVDVNPFMTELTGYAREHFLGKRLWEIGTFEDTAASKAQFSVLQTEDYARYDDLPLKTADGRAVDVEFVSNAYLVEDKRVIQCNIRDITIRKRAENELRMLHRAIQAVSQGILITDALGPDNPIVYASPGFTRLTGYERDEVLGRNYSFLHSKDTDPVALAALRDARREERGCEAEILNQRKDGTAFWNHLVVAPVRDAEDRLTNYVYVQTDVTERRALESQFRQVQKMEAVGRLAGGVAHDFNNVLSVILSYAELMTSELSPDDPRRADLGEIGKAALRAAGLTAQLLAFSRQQVLKPKVLDLNQSITGIEKMLHQLLGADIQLTMLPSSELWSVKADPGQVEQVLMNLAVNGRDAMPQGGELTIETENVTLDDSYARAHHSVPAGQYVMLAVSDNGIGMSREIQARIFEPFFTTKDVGKGTGLGLATVFGIVKQSGGHIWLYSEPGKGTTFKIYLPRVRGAAEADVTPQPVEESRLAHETILLVEDDDQVRTVAESILRRSGYVVLTAPNGGEAFLICEKHGARIDLLLTDVVLPRMSGRQLAIRLAPLRPAMKVLYMSGYTDDAILQHGVLDSGVAYLQKPLTPASLTRKVSDVLHG